MRRCRRWLALALVVSGLWPAAVAALDGTGPVVEVASDRLPNGLELYVYEDHTAPVVSVNLWYRVGSRDEPIGRRGMAHLLRSEEHTSELQSRENLVCRLLLEKKK